MTREIVLAGGMCTPFGDFGKSLKDIPLAALAQSDRARRALARDRAGRFQR